MKTQNIIIIVVVVVIIGIAYTKFSKSIWTAGGDATIQPAKLATIPAAVQKHLRDFDESQKMMYEGFEYQVVNGAWVAL